MNCEIIKDLIPLYIDGCCSKESERAVAEHLKDCSECKKLFEEMKEPTDIIAASVSPKALSKINDLKASVLQSVLLFASFGLIIIGVAVEAYAGSDSLGNGLFAFNLVVPATGFMLSLANWYFVRSYKNRKTFSNCSLLITLCITICAFVWSSFHYELNFVELFAGIDFIGFLDIMQGVLFLGGIGILLTLVFCVLSKTLSDIYAKMLGKE
ncbi:MAG: zf-HC2 domain-containing protein [Clostridia bacterium]|nr:zf-HC2 domain-containing protein [Clostridia bacterium]